MEGMFLPFNVQSKIVIAESDFHFINADALGFPGHQYWHFEGQAGHQPSISIWWVGNDNQLSYFVLFSSSATKVFIFHSESSTYSFSSIHSLFNTCNGLSQGNKICLGTEGCVNRLGDISPKPGRFAHMGLWDRGAHSQSETPILWGQSGESTAPRTKGVLSPASHHLISCVKEHLWSTTVEDMLPIESCAEVMENAQLLPLWYQLISIQWWMGGVHSHSELSVSLCEHFLGEWEKQGSVSPFSGNHIHCELFGWGETCLDLNNVSLTHETRLSDTKAEKKQGLGFNKCPNTYKAKHFLLYSLNNLTCIF